MFHALQVLIIVPVAVGMGLSLAHALELSGKLRLSRETYVTVQSVYYPGFTIGGLFGEFAAWTLTHPVNKFWLADQNLRGAARRFFDVDGKTKKPGPRCGTDGNTCMSCARPSPC